LTHGPVSVLVRRGSATESEHRVAWRLCDERGAVLAAGGDDVRTFTRSTVKPLQALPAVRAGVLERFGLDDRHLAVACASHGGADAHVTRVSEVLAACGIPESALGCGPLAPRDPAAAAALPGPPRRIHHNCSGKHALALALCVARDWPVPGYLDADHPLQRALRESVAAALAAGAPLPEAVDGCGMRTWQVTLGALAAAFARLASGAPDAAAARAAGAMRAHPELVAYRGAIDTELMRGAPGAVAKAGAEGLLCLGLPGGRGLALKVLDGAARAVDPAAVTLARDVLGLRLAGPAFDKLAAPVVRNSRGEAVGALEAGLE
jgi:L-asparaginase II